jgi:hypothetical protein
LAGLADYAGSGAFGRELNGLGLLQSKRMASVLLTAEQHEKNAEACYKAAQDKDVPPAKRLEFRMTASGAGFSNGWRARRKPARPSYHPSPSVSRG